MSEKKYVVELSEEERESLKSLVRKGTAARPHPAQGRPGDHGPAWDDARISEGRVGRTMQRLADKLVELKVVDTVSDETVRRTLKKRGLAVADGAVVPPRVDSEYRRCGTANLFLAFAPLLGGRTVQVTERRTAVDFATFLKWVVDDVFEAARRVVLVTDNLNVHTTGSLYQAFAPAEARRIAWHDTPKHGSWLNVAECELSALSRQCLNWWIASRDALAREIDAWVDDRNHRMTEVKWRFTTADARIKLHRLYPSLQ